MTATILAGCGAKETAPAAESGTKEEASAEKASDEAAPAAEEKTSYSEDEIADFTMFITMPGSEINDDNEIAQINKEIDALKLASSYNDDTQTRLSDVEGAFAFFKENFDTLSIENKRNFLRQCISKIMWDGENLHIFTKSL